MEEKKKRVRATLTQVRALESELSEVREELRLTCLQNGHLREELSAIRTGDVVPRAVLDEQIEGTSRLVRDCDAWREKYQGLVAKCRTLEQSNGCLDDELVRMRSARDNAVRRCQELMQEVRNIKNRGFWSRVFNRNY